MPACHSKPLKDDQLQKGHEAKKYRFDLSNLPKKGWSVRGVAVEDVNGEDHPVLLFGRAGTKKLRTPTTEEFAAALKLADENTRPKFEFISIADSHPFAGRHYNRFSPAWLKGTLFGDTLFEGDVEMKLLSHKMRIDGESYVSSDRVYPGLKGPDQFPYSYGGSSPIYLTCRSVKVSTTSRSCLFMGEPDMCITMDSNPSYSGYVSSLYEVFGCEDAPVLLSVRELPKLLLAAEWLKKQGFEMDEHWLEEVTQPSASASNVLAATKQEEFNSREIADLLSKGLDSVSVEDGSMSVKITNVQASPNRLSCDLTQTVHSPDGDEVAHQVKSCRMSDTDFDWLFEDIPVKIPVSGSVIPSENSWSDLRAATIAPFWSMQYDDKEQKVDGMSWGGCSMTSFNAEPCHTQRKAKSTAWKSTPAAGGSHVSYQNGLVGAVGMQSATGKGLDDDEIADLKKATTASRKSKSRVPKWDAAKSGSSRGTTSRLLGAVDSVTGMGDVHDETGRRIIDSHEVHTRMDVSEQKNGKEVQPPVTVISRVSLAKPALPLGPTEPKPQKKVPLPPSLVAELKTQFKCTICHHAPMKAPVVAASCCGSILGCEGCVSDYYSRCHTSCPSCHSSDGYSKTFRLHGIDEILQALSNGVASVDSAVFAESLKCTVCHSAPLSSQPAVATCCGRIVGCSDCIKRWHKTKDQCPLCSQDGGRDNTVRVSCMGTILQKLDEFFHAAELRSP